MHNVTPTTIILPTNSVFYLRKWMNLYSFFFRKSITNSLTTGAARLICYSNEEILLHVVTLSRYIITEYLQLLHDMKDIANVLLNGLIKAPTISRYVRYVITDIAKCFNEAIANTIIKAVTC